MFSISLIYVVENKSILLLKRSSFMKAYPSSVCFPGGRYELQDNSVFMTAIRETYEETHIILSEKDLIRPLDTCETSKGEVISPFLFRLVQMPLNIQLSVESESWIWLPQYIFSDKKNYEINHLAKKHMLKLHYNEHIIWGVTASILYEVFIKSEYLKA